MKGKLPHDKYQTDAGLEVRSLEHVKKLRGRWAVRKMERSGRKIGWSGA